MLQRRFLRWTKMSVRTRFTVESLRRTKWDIHRDSEMSVCIRATNICWRKTRMRIVAREREASYEFVFFISLDLVESWWRTKKNNYSRVTHFILPRRTERYLMKFSIDEPVDAHLTLAKSIGKCFELGVSLRFYRLGKDRHPEDTSECRRLTSMDVHQALKHFKIESPKVPGNYSISYSSPQLSKSWEEARIVLHAISTETHWWDVTVDSLLNGQCRIIRMTKDSLVQFPSVAELERGKWRIRFVSPSMTQ